MSHGYNLRVRKSILPVTEGDQSSKKRKASPTLGDDSPKKQSSIVKVTKQKKLKLEPKEEPIIGRNKSKASQNKASIAKQVVKKTEDQVVTQKTDQLVSHVLAFGDDTAGEMGLGEIGISKKFPYKVASISDLIIQVACGAMHTLCLTKDGEVCTFGCNDEMTLGRKTNGDEELDSTPTKISLPDRVTKVTAGDSHSAALTYKGHVYIWGNFKDEHGSVGLTPECDGKPCVEPIRLMEKIVFKDIASGSNHMLLLDTDGRVYSFGVAEQGQLGRIAQEDIKQIKPDNRELYLRPTVVDLSNVDSKRTFICDAVFAGNFSSFATNTDKMKNRLAGWGLNNYSQLGFKGAKNQLVQYFAKRSTFTCSTSMKSVACGQHHTIFLTKTGRVYSAGRHEYGRLGLGNIKEAVCPAKCIESLRDEKVVDISAGLSTSFAVTDEGKLYSWGMAGTNLGLKEDEDALNPTEVVSKQLACQTVQNVSAGSSYTVILTTDKSNK